MQVSTSVEAENGEMIVKRVSVPIGLEELMEGLAKEVILKKPKDIYVFASEYFTNLLNLRNKGLLQGIPTKRAQSVTKQITQQRFPNKQAKSLDSSIQTNIRSDSLKNIANGTRKYSFENKKTDKAKMVLDRRRSDKLANIDNSDKNKVTTRNKDKTPRSRSSSTNSRSKSEDEKNKITSRDVKFGKLSSNKVSAKKIAQKREESPKKVDVDKPQKSAQNLEGVEVIAKSIPLVTKNINRRSSSKLSVTENKDDIEKSTKFGNEVEIIKMEENDQNSELQNNCIGCKIAEDKAVDLVTNIKTIEEINKNQTESDMKSGQVNLTDKTNSEENLIPENKNKVTEDDKIELLEENQDLKEDDISKQRSQAVDEKVFEILQAEDENKQNVENSNEKATESQFQANATTLSKQEVISQSHEILPTVEHGVLENKENETEKIDNDELQKATQTSINNNEPIEDKVVKNESKDMLKIDADDQSLQTKEKHLTKKETTDLSKKQSVENNDVTLLPISSDSTVKEITKTTEKEQIGTKILETSLQSNVKLPEVVASDANVRDQTDSTDSQDLNSKKIELSNENSEETTANSAAEEHKNNSSESETSSIKIHKNDIEDFIKNEKNEVPKEDNLNLLDVTNEDVIEKNDASLEHVKVDNKQMAFVVRGQNIDHDSKEASTAQGIKVDNKQKSNQGNEVFDKKLIDQSIIKTSDTSATEKVKYSNDKNCSEVSDSNAIMINAKEAISKNLENHVSTGDSQTVEAKELNNEKSTNESQILDEDTKIKDEKVHDLSSSTENLTSNNESVDDIKIEKNIILKDTEEKKINSAKSTTVGGLVNDERVRDSSITSKLPTEYPQIKSENENNKESVTQDDEDSKIDEAKAGFHSSNTSLSNKRSMEDQIIKETTQSKENNASRNKSGKDSLKLDDEDNLSDSNKYLKNKESADELISDVINSNEELKNVQTLNKNLRSEISVDNLKPKSIVHPSQNNNKEVTEKSEVDLLKSHNKEDNLSDTNENIRRKRSANDLKFEKTLLTNEDDKSNNDKPASPEINNKEVKSSETTNNLNSKQSSGNITPEETNFKEKFNSNCDKEFPLKPEEIKYIEMSDEIGEIKTSQNETIEEIDQSQEETSLKNKEGESNVEQSLVDGVKINKKPSLENQFVDNEKKPSNILPLSRNENATEIRQVDKNFVEKSDLSLLPEKSKKDIAVILEKSSENRKLPEVTSASPDNFETVKTTIHLKDSDDIQKLESKEIKASSDFSSITQNKQPIMEPSISGNFKNDTNASEKSQVDKKNGSEIDGNVTVINVDPEEDNEGKTKSQDETKIVRDDSKRKIEANLSSLEEDMKEQEKDSTIDTLANSPTKEEANILSGLSKEKVIQQTKAGPINLEKSTVHGVQRELIKEEGKYSKNNILDNVLTKAEENIVSDLSKENIVETKEARPINLAESKATGTQEENIKEKDKEPSVNTLDDTPTKIEENILKDFSKENDMKQKEARPINYEESTLDGVQEELIQNEKNDLTSHSLENASTKTEENILNDLLKDNIVKQKETDSINIQDSTKFIKEDGEGLTSDTLNDTKAEKHILNDLSKENILKQKKVGPINLEASTSDAVQEELINKEGIDLTNHTLENGSTKVEEKNLNNLLKENIVKEKETDPINIQDSTSGAVHEKLIKKEGKELTSDNLNATKAEKNILNDLSKENILNQKEVAPINLVDSTSDGVQEELINKEGKVLTNHTLENSHTKDEEKILNDLLKENIIKQKEASLINLEESTAGGVQEKVIKEEGKDLTTDTLDNASTKAEGNILNNLSKENIINQKIAGPINLEDDTATRAQDEIIQKQEKEPTADVLDDVLTKVEEDIYRLSKEKIIAQTQAESITSKPNADTGVQEENIIKQVDAQQESEPKNLEIIASGEKNKIGETKPKRTEKLINKVAPIAVDLVKQNVVDKVTSNVKKSKEEIKLNRNRTKSMSYDQLKSPRDVKEESKNRRIKSMDSSKKNSLVKSKSQQRLSVSSQGLTKHEEKKKTINKTRSASVDVGTINKPKSKPNLAKSQSNFDISKLQKEIHQVEKEAKMVNYKSSYNPFILRQEIKNASKPEETKMGDVAGRTMAALKIQSLWRGFVSRKQLKKSKGERIEETKVENIIPQINKDLSQISKEHDSVQTISETKNNLENLRIGTEISPVKEKHEVKEKEEEDSGVATTSTELNSVKDDNEKNGIEHLASIKVNGPKDKLLLENEIKLAENINKDAFLNEKETDHVKDEEDMKTIAINSQEVHATTVTDMIKEAAVPIVKEKGNEERKIIENAEVESEGQEKITNNQNTDQSLDDLKIENQKISDELRDNAKQLSQQDESDSNLAEIETAKSVMDIKENLENVAENRELKQSVINQKISGIEHANNDLINSSNEENMNPQSNANGTEKTNNEESIEKHSYGEVDAVQGHIINKTGTVVPHALEVKEGINKQISMADAVLKIQTLWRGFNIRRLRKRGELFGNTVEIENKKPEGLRSATKLKTTFNSALKIQAAWRGYKVRKNIKDVNQKLAELQNRSECDELPSQRGPTNEDIMRAAAKIQAGVRGFMVRKRINKNSLKSITEEHTDNNRITNEQIEQALKNLPEIPKELPSERKLARAVTVDEPKCTQKLVKALSLDSRLHQDIIKLKYNSLEDDENIDSPKDKLGGYVINELNDHQKIDHYDRNKELTLIMEDEEFENKSADENLNSKDTITNKIHNNKNMENLLDAGKTKSTNELPETDLKAASGSNSFVNNVDKPLKNGECYENAPTRPVTSDIIQEHTNNQIFASKTESSNQNKQSELPKNVSSKKLDENKEHQVEGLFHDINEQTDQIEIKNNIIKEESKHSSLESADSSDSIITVIRNESGDNKQINDISNIKNEKLSDNSFNINQLKQEIEMVSNLKPDLSQQKENNLLENNNVNETVQQKNKNFVKVTDVEIGIVECKQTDTEKLNDKNQTEFQNGADIVKDPNFNDGHEKLKEESITTSGKRDPISNKMKEENSSNINNKPILETNENKQLTDNLKEGKTIKLGLNEFLRNISQENANKNNLISNKEEDNQIIKNVDNVKNVIIDKPDLHEQDENNIMEPKGIPSTLLQDTETNTSISNIVNDTNNQTISPLLQEEMEKLNEKIGKIVTDDMSGDKSKITNSVESSNQVGNDKSQGDLNLENLAATKIQSTYRGYCVRKNLKTANTNSLSHLQIPLRELSDIKEEENDVKSIESYDDIHHNNDNKVDVGGVKEEDKVRVDGDGEEMTAGGNIPLKNIMANEKEQSLEEKQQQQKQQPAQVLSTTKINLVHTGEFHDTITVPLPLSPPIQSCSNENEVELTNGPTTGLIHSGELHDTVLPVSSQTSQAPPAGAEVLTSSPFDSCGRVAQASNKDASTCATEPDTTTSSATNGMETEKRNNAKSLPKKNMEVEAATKIQAGFRGYQVRKQLKNKIGAPGDISNQRRSARRKSSGRLTESGRITQMKVKNPTELEEKSAVKIQAGIRGFLVRRRQQKKEKSNKNSS